MLNRSWVNLGEVVVVIVSGLGEMGHGLVDNLDGCRLAEISLRCFLH